MLRFHSATGSIEASAQQEARVRALSDQAIVRELRVADPDLFVLAEAISRSIVVPDPAHGWRIAGSIHPAGTVAH